MAFRSLNVGRLTSLLFVCLVMAGRAGAQVGTLPDERRAQIESAVAAFMATSKTPGVSVAVVRDGVSVWSAGFGMADLENAVPATAQTVYRVGSISKPLTAVAAMTLWQQGKLDLDAPVQKYCPLFPQKPWPITTRQLLGHLAGIRSYRVPEFPYWDSQSDPEVGNTRHFDNGIEGGLQFFADEPLVSEPDTHFNYSTQGYTVAGCAIEGASGKKYADYVRDSVLAPSGMQQTRPDDRFAVVPFRTRFYSKDRSGQVINAEFLDSSYKVPGGGWLSTAPDLARFAAAVLADRLVTRATREVMWTQKMPKDRLGRMAYGLGWQFGSVHTLASVGHGGSQQGTSASLVMVPDSRAAVVVMTNADGVDAGGLAKRLLGIVQGAAPDRKEVALAPAVLDGLLGAYQVMDFRLTVAREGARLFVLVNGAKIPLAPVGPRDFRVGDSDNEITFVTDGNGRATELVTHEGATDLILTRTP